MLVEKNIKNTEVISYKFLIKDATVVALTMISTNVTLSQGRHLKS